MRLRILVIPLLLWAVNSVVAADLKSLENISEELVEIRQEIANLHDEINFEKTRYNDQVRSYSSQKSDLEVKVSRAELNFKELQQELNKLRSLNQEKYKAYDDVIPVLKESIDALRQTVSQSLPFKLNDRLQALDDIERRMETDVISPNKAANQLWAFVEDELVLGRSSGIYNESVELNGEQKLVKVLRLGKVAMFYKSRDEEYGVLSQVDGDWTQQALTDEADIRQLDKLFDSFSKNIRNGIFTVPNYLPQS